VTIVRQVHCARPAAKAIATENENLHSENPRPLQYERMLQSASYYKCSADPSCHRHKGEDQHSSTKQQPFAGGALGFALLYLHLHHAGFFGKGIEPPASFFGDLHGWIFQMPAPFWS